MVVRMEVLLDQKRVAAMVPKLRTNIPYIGDRLGWQIAMEYARQIKFFAPRKGAGVRGYLKESIKARKLKHGDYAVVMARYGWYREMGRGPGKGPPLTSQFIRWARGHGIPPMILQRHIAARGTRPHPFIRPGIMRAKTHIDKWIRRYAKMMVSPMIIRGI